MRLVFLTAVLLTVTGCHDQLVGTPQEHINKARPACRDGVEYLIFNNSHGDSAAPHMKPDGTVFTCNY